MSIAISNGQTKAVIMRINEFTQVTHDDGNADDDDDKKNMNSEDPAANGFRISQMRQCQISRMSEICSLDTIGRIFTLSVCVYIVWCAK